MRAGWDLVISTRGSGGLAVGELLDGRGLGLGRAGCHRVRQRRHGFGGASTSSTGAGLGCRANLSLVGFDDLDFARYARVPLTTVRQPVTEQVRYAVRSLAGALHGTPLVARAITLRRNRARRRSCGCRTRSRERVLSWPLPGETPGFRQRLARPPGERRHQPPSGPHTADSTS